MPPILLTRRMRLRTPREGDLENIYRLGSSPRVMRYITPGKTQSREDAVIDLQKRIAASAKEFGYWVAEEKETEAFIGWMALKPLNQSEDIELGYRFLEEYWGRGLATEGGFKILEYAFRTLGLERVVAIAVEENRASTRVMEKLGMCFVKEGRFYDTHCVFYEIRKEAWNSSAER